MLASLRGFTHTDITIYVGGLGPATTEPRIVFFVQMVVGKRVDVDYRDALKVAYAELPNQEVLAIALHPQEANSGTGFWQLAQSTSVFSSFLSCKGRRTGFGRRLLQLFQPKPGCLAASSTTVQPEPIRRQWKWLPVFGSCPLRVVVGLV